MASPPIGAQLLPSLLLETLFRLGFPPSSSRSSFSSACR